MGRIRCKVSRGAVIFWLGGLVFGLREWRRGAEGLLDELFPVAVVLGCIALHELGHLVMARWVGVEVRGVRIGLLGARLELAGLMSYSKEMAVALGGPMANLLSAAAVYPVWRGNGGDGLLLFLVVSVLLAAVNLLPVGTLDGGRVLYCGTARLWGEDAARGIRGVTTGVFLGGLWLFSVYGLLLSARFLSLFAFSFCLLLRSTDERGI